MPDTATQTTPFPTRKLTAMFVGVPLLYPLFGPAVTEAWPQIAPTFLAGDAVTSLMSALPAVALGGLIAYFVPDAPNMPDTLGGGNAVRERR